MQNAYQPPKHKLTLAELSASAKERQNADATNLVLDAFSENLLNRGAKAALVANGADSADARSHETEDLVAAISTENLGVAAMAKEAKIDIYTTYCAKTGQPIGKRDPGMIEKLIAIHGLETAEALTDYIDLTSGVAPHWIKTDNVALRELQKHDPYGYFMYALFFVLEKNQPWYSMRKGVTDHKARQEFRKSMITGWQTLQFVPLEKIARANEVWRKTLSFLQPVQLRFLKTFRPEEFCTIKGVDMVCHEIERIVKNILLQEYTYKERINRNDFKRLMANFPGISAFRRQGLDEFNEYDAAIDALMDEFGLQDLAQYLPGVSWDDEKTEKKLKRGVRATVVKPAKRGTVPTMGNLQTSQRKPAKSLRDLVKPQSGTGFKLHLSTKPKGE